MKIKFPYVFTTDASLLFALCTMLCSLGDAISPLRLQRLYMKTRHGQFRNIFKAI